MEANMTYLRIQRTSSAQYKQKWLDNVRPLKKQDGYKNVAGTCHLLAKLHDKNRISVFAWSDFPL
jgi:hypothetical protein